MKYYFILIFSVLSLVVVVYNMANWIIISSNVSSFEEAKNLSIARYPQFLQSVARITLLNIILSTLAGVGFLKLEGINGNLIPGIIKFLAWFSFFLAAWQAFSLL